MCALWAAVYLAKTLETLLVLGEILFRTLSQKQTKKHEDDMKNKSLKAMYTTLRVILGDQLNAEHSWYTKKEDTVLYLIAEMPQETQYVKHHIQKLCAFFAAMENFAQALQQAGHHVLHLTLDDHHFNTLNELLVSICTRFTIANVEYQQPDEYRLYQQFVDIKLPKNITINGIDSEHFLLPYADIANYFTKGKHHKMEFFYRKMRQRFAILMDNNGPEGGQWNYDADNRKKLKPTNIDNIPEPLLFTRSVDTILQRLKKHKVDYFGTVKDPLTWPTTRQESQQLLDYFCQYCLPLFGTFQDAMTANSPHKWSLYHSRLSFSLNTKMLHPLHVINTAVAAYRHSKGAITLPQIEGFVRQILGWREYIRGVYWCNMPEYAHKNALATTTPLPQYFWTGDTRMNCMHQTITQSLEYAYAHHIQRLMVTGNFCLISGINIDQVDEWYLGIYLDAIEWVEMPNTRGMSQFADGGIVATKPYAASGNYINKMSDYCKDCYYNVSKKDTPDACPANSLYWDFMTRHRERFEKNPRIGMIYRTWDKQSEDKQQSTLQRAKWCLENIESL